MERWHKAFVIPAFLLLAVFWFSYAPAKCEKTGNPPSKLSNTKPEIQNPNSEIGNVYGFKLESPLLGGDLGVGK